MNKSNFDSETHITNKEHMALLKMIDKSYF